MVQSGWRTFFPQFRFFCCDNLVQPTQMLLYYRFFLHIMSMTNRPRGKVTVSVFIALSFLSFLFLNTVYGSITGLEANGQMPRTVENKIQNQTDTGDKQNIVRLLASL